MATSVVDPGPLSHLMSSFLEERKKAFSDRMDGLVFSHSASDSASSALASLFVDWAKRRHEALLLGLSQVASELHTIPGTGIATEESWAKMDDVLERLCEEKVLKDAITTMLETTLHSVRTMLYKASMMQYAD